MPGADALPPALPRRRPIVQARRMPGYAGLVVIPDPLFDLDFTQAAVFGTVALGGAGAGGFNDSSPGNYVTFNAHTASAAITLTTVRFISGSANGSASIRAAVYAADGTSGQPGTLLAQSADVLGVTSGTNAISLSVPVEIGAGQTVWIATHQSANFVYSVTGTGGVGTNSRFVARTFGLGLPASAPATSALTSQRYDLWAEGTGFISPAVAQLAAAGFVFARSGTAWGPDGTAYADGVPRIIPGVGLLIEGSRQNTCLRSQEFDHATWAKTNLAVTANGLAAPDGTATADLLTRTSTAASCYCGQPQSFTAGTAYTASVFAKAGTLGGRLGMRLSTGYPARVDALFDLTTGTVVGSQANTWTGVSATITPLPGGWYRCTLTGTASATANNNFFCGPTDSGTTNAWEATSAVLSDVHVWQAQVEVGSFASSPIVTSGSAVTRAAETCVATRSAGSLDAGTVAVEVQLAPGFAAGEHQYQWSADTGASSDALAVYRKVDTTQFGGLLNTGGVAQANVLTGTPASGGTFKLAARWATNDFALSVGGAAPGTDTSLSLPALVYERLGYGIAANRIAWGYIRRVRRFAAALDDATLRSLSA